MINLIRRNWFLHSIMTILVLVFVLLSVRFFSIRKSNQEISTLRTTITKKLDANMKFSYGVILKQTIMTPKPATPIEISDSLERNLGHLQDYWQINATIPCNLNFVVQNLDLEYIELQTAQTSIESKSIQIAKDHLSRALEYESNSTWYFNFIQSIKECQ